MYDTAMLWTSSLSTGSCLECSAKLHTDTLRYVVPSTSLYDDLLDALDKYAVSVL